MILWINIEPNIDISGFHYNQHDNKSQSQNHQTAHNLGATFEGLKHSEIIPNIWIYPLLRRSLTSATDSKLPIVKPSPFFSLM